MVSWHLERTVRSLFADATFGGTCAAEVAASDRASFLFRAVSIRAARSTSEARYVTRLVAKLPTVFGWGRDAEVMMLGEAIDRKEPSMLSGYTRKKKSGLPFWADTVRFERRARSAAGPFVGWH